MASNQGKTTITAGLAYHHRQQGKRVRVFKTGPDFLDPMILEKASNNLVYQLDLWMTGEEECRRLLFDAAADADIILIEGVMGLFDGDPSSADLAERFGVPVCAVIHAGSMAQTFGAITHGLASYREKLKLMGVFANGVASERHEQMLLAGQKNGTRYLGSLFREEKLSLPSRHLGLVQASELSNLEDGFAATANRLNKCEISKMPDPIAFHSEKENPFPQLLKRKKIAIARDAAFSFIYPANLDILRRHGAELQFFSPLADKELLPCDALYLPGGYPELHLDQLEKNVEMKMSIKKHIEQKKPAYAECGGMLYLLDTLSDSDGKTGKMVGLLSGKAVMQRRLSSLGYQHVDTGNGVLRGHTFHYSKSEVVIPPINYATRLHGNTLGEPLYKVDNLRAGYLHLYFGSNPIAAAKLFID
jgi:cobyrinic acid a,c-diamide synthase